MEKKIIKHSVFAGQEFRCFVSYRIDENSTLDFTVVTTLPVLNIMDMCTSVIKDFNPDNVERLYYEPKDPKVSVNYGTKESKKD